MEEKETTTKTCNGTEHGGAPMLKMGTETGSLVILQVVKEEK